MWLGPPTMVTSRPSIMHYFFIPFMVLIQEMSQIQHILFGPPTCPHVRFHTIFLLYTSQLIKKKTCQNYNANDNKNQIKKHNPLT